MQIIKTIKDMQTLSRRLRSEKKTIGFVPTMGALHEGHFSLVKRSKNENDITIVSIFVNPTQFGPKEDFQQYPRDLEGDIKKLSSISADIVFAPENHEMYPKGFSTIIDVGSIGDILCGASRSGHFNGVATVVAKLFNIIIPDKAYFGQKDFQQSVVIKKLIKELNFDIDIVVCPTIREKDGLAKSSRNCYLNQNERNSATILYKALKHAETLIINGVKDSSYIKREMEDMIKSELLAKIEYVEIVNPQSFKIAKTIELPIVICLAVRIGSTRLIDNLPVYRFR